MSRIIRRALPFLAIAAIAGAACEVPIKKAPPKPAPPVEVDPAPPDGQPDPCATPAVGLDPFTEHELENNWGPDRQVPSGGVQSVSFDGCDDVAQLGIDSGNATPGGSGFTLTEGIKNPPGPSASATGNFGHAVQINLFLDPAWQDNATRAGLWVVGDDGDGARDNLFGILEFTHIEPSTDGTPAITDDFEGWRIWESDPGEWINLPTNFTYGEWVTLRIALDTSTQEYNYFVNGVLVGTATGGANFIREVFINHYNFGTHEFPTLNNESYAGHWFAGV